MNYDYLMSGWVHTYFPLLNFRKLYGGGMGKENGSIHVVEK